MKIDETWSAVGLRVEAFSMEVEASCQYKLVLCSGVEAPFQEWLVNEIRGLEIPYSSTW